MSLAYKEAEKGYLLNEVPVGAILVDNATNSVISSAYNQVIKHKNSTKHAEMLLIEMGCKKKDSKYLVNTSIFITLEPCAMCAAAISEVKIDRIYFGAYDEKNGSLESIMKIYNNKNYYVPEVYGGINEIESSKILKKFFQEKRK
jgi:cytosine deaminase